MIKLPSTFSVRDHSDKGCAFRTISCKGIRLVMEITGRCNLLCRHCFACSEQTELNTSEWLNIVKFLPAVNVRKVIVTGGEPLLRLDIEEIIAEITSLDIGVDLNTNMTAFTLKRAQKLKQSGLSELSVSLDGLQEYHDWFRNKPGNFERVIRGIELAVSMGFEVDVHGACTPGNIDEIGQVIDLCTRLGVSSYTALSVVSLGQGIAGLTDQQFMLDDEHRAKLHQVFKIKRKQYKTSMAIRSRDIFQHPSCSVCPMGETVLGITPTGKLMPCLLANYQPGKNENLSQYPLPDALDYLRNRVKTEDKQLRCSNHIEISSQ